MNQNSDLDLFIERVVDVAPEQIWKAWTTPEHLMPWFCPKPWKVTKCTIDLRPGGLFHTTMQSPEGQEFPNNGCFLEIIPNKKLVFTDSLLVDFRPSPNAFMTAVINLEAHGSGTKYTARALHKDLAGKKQHEEMGFVQEWNTALHQMVAYIKDVMAK